MGSEDDHTPPDPAVTSPPVRRSRAAVVGAALLAVLGVGLIVLALVDQQGPPPAPEDVARPPALAAGPPPPSAVAPTPVPTTSAASSPPASLRIPAIGVSSSVGQVGLNPDRTMEVPAKGTPAYDHAAWYRFSVTPGQQGPSVLIGHVDSREEGPSVFYDLGRLRPGDRAEVVRADGVVVSFEVTDVRRVPKDAFPSDLVYGATPGPELRLITCGGDFDPTASSYRDNTVVFAREV